MGCGLNSSQNFLAVVLELVDVVLYHIYVVSVVYICSFLLWLSCFIVFKLCLERVRIRRAVADIAGYLCYMFQCTAVHG